ALPAPGRPQALSWSTLIELALLHEEEMIRRRLLILAAFTVLSAGCGGGEFPVAKVSGRVTLNGQPVDKVSVMFQPIAAEGKLNSGMGSYGITDTDGRYTLKLIGKETKGAV